MSICVIESLTYYKERKALYGTEGIGRRGRIISSKGVVSLRNFDTSDAKVGSKRNDGNFLNDAKIDPNGVPLENKKSPTMEMVEPSLPPVGDENNLLNNLKGVNKKKNSI